MSELTCGGGGGGGGGGVCVSLPTCDGCACACACACVFVCVCVCVFPSSSSRLHPGRRMDPQKISDLKAFVQLCQNNSTVLHLPEMEFFRTWLKGSVQLSNHN